MSIFKDFDGNEYTTVTINDQVWSAQDLRTTSYDDGSPIKEIIKNEEWNECTTPAFCWYNNDESVKGKFGAFYNWYAVKTGLLAPKGYHVATNEEWDLLEKYLIENGYNYDTTISGSKIAKALAAKTDWVACSDVGAIGNDLTQNDKGLGFMSIPAGYRCGGNEIAGGRFFCQGINNYWWTSTEYDRDFAWYRGIYDEHYSLCRQFVKKNWGFSIRLVAD